MAHNSQVDDNHGTLREFLDSLPPRLHANSLPATDFLYNNQLFACFGRAITFNSIPNESTLDLIKQFVPQRNSMINRPHEWPPKDKTLQWWRAMCAFRELPLTGSRADLQAR